MPEMPTVFEQPRANALALPGFACAVCLLVVGSMLARGIPADTSSRVVSGVFALGAIASAIWFLRWWGLPPGRLTVDHEAIVMSPFGRNSRPRKIARRPNSRLHTKRRSGGANYNVTTVSLFDEAVGEQRPLVVIGAFDVNAVLQACRDHGWDLADS